MVNFKTWCTTRSCDKVSSSPFSPGRKYQKICSVLTFAFLIYLIVSGIVSAPAGAAYMFASDVDDGYLKRIDQTTGAATNVGPIGAPGEVRGLSASPYPNIVYGAETSGQKLWTINVGTGAGSPVGGVFGYDIRELAYDPVNNVLYGTDLSKLYTVDQNSGAAALVGTFGLDIVFAWALDYDTATSRIYGVDTGWDQLFWADPSTGGATLIGGPTRYNVTDIAFDRETGDLYGIENGENPDYFFTIDKTTGATANIGPMGEPINVLGLAKPIPEPASFFLLGSGLLSLVWLVRKKAGRC